MRPAPKRRIVVVPTYQEREALPHFVEAFESTGFDALVVDDDSPDGTGAWAEEAARHHGWLHVLRRARKEGLGYAYRAGFAWCLEREYDVVGQMDVDLSHEPAALPALEAALDAGADLVIGSRFVRGGTTPGWPRWRKVQSYAAVLPARVVLRIPVRDLTGGFKLWRADALRAIDVGATISRGYVIQIETTYRAFRAGLRVREVPIRFAERDAGESKMTGAIKREGIGVVVRLARERWDPRNER
jgi:dolichol-phosphate mannosyltransferase